MEGGFESKRQVLTIECIKLGGMSVSSTPNDFPYSITNNSILLWSAVRR